jgi:ribonuclease D
VIMHDSTLEELCRKQPSSLEQLRHVPGFGAVKTQTYGPQVIEALNSFRGGTRAGAQPGWEAARSDSRRAALTKLLSSENKSF